MWISNSDQSSVPATGRRPGVTKRTRCAFARVVASAAASGLGIGWPGGGGGGEEAGSVRGVEVPVE